MLGFGRAPGGRLVRAIDAVNTAIALGVAGHAGTVHTLERIPGTRRSEAMQRCLIGSCFENRSH